MANHNLVSIEIGSYNIKLTTGHYENNTVIVEGAYSIKTPKDCFKDGKLLQAENNKKELIKSIQELLSKNKARAKDVIFTTQGTGIIRRELEIPAVRPQEIESLIRYEIEQYLPIDLSEYVVEYKQVNGKNDNKDNKQAILVAAFPRDTANGYLSLAKALGLEPKALDINSNAISKLFDQNLYINNNEYTLDKTIALVDIGHSSINTIIVSKGDYQFSRLISYGGSELDAAFSDYYNISLKDAEIKKLSEAWLEPTEHTEQGPANKHLREIVYRWTEDIQKVFQYYKTRNASNRIDEIYLSGGSSNIKGIDSFVEASTSIPTQQIKSISSIKLSKQAADIDLIYYLNTIGAMIRK